MIQKTVNDYIKDKEIYIVDGFNSYCTSNNYKELSQLLTILQDKYPTFDHICINIIYKESVLPGSLNVDRVSNATKPHYTRDGFKYFLTKNMTNIHDKIFTRAISIPQEIIDMIIYKYFDLDSRKLGMFI